MRPSRPDEFGDYRPFIPIAEKLDWKLTTPIEVLKELFEAQSNKAVAEALKTFPEWKKQ
jgi:hypothetical protein